ncbi:cytochrome c oxidase subunit II [Pseudorhodoferax sp. Leaf274]|uniref:cytochrome c oxidase subunit II n=1 Tax=Pseudorhodoferax sp. Leaf274 TaxID=1736318 RepID=UPI00190FF058|nr:cytochrome c oxidase subunit II [Pseudorhodoferax sp. Leaf274]
MLHGAAHSSGTPHTRTAGRGAAWACGLSAIALLAGCSTAGPLSALDPAGPGAAPIARVWWAMFWGGMALTVAMTGLALYAALRRRAGTPRVSANALLVGGGLLLPGAVIAALLLWGMRAGHALLPLPGAAPVFTVEVTARQWQWDARYPQHPTAPSATNRIDIPAGQPVDVHVRTADVIHGFWVPRLGGKIDAIPGRTNVIRLQADAPGVYRGVCAEYCGTGHARMPMEVHAHAPDALAARLAGGTP